MSTLRVNTLQTQAGVEVYTAKAWVNFNGTGTVAIRASGNVSSITDNGTGNYTVNFTTAMSDANYSITGTVSNNSSTGSMILCPAGNTTAPTASACRIETVTASLAYDSPYVYVAIFR